MKKAASSKAPASVGAYIKSFPKPMQVILNKIRSGIKATAPKAEETIKYMMPTYVYNGRNLVHFAAWEKHIGFYPTPTPIVAFEKDLSKYHVAKGSILFPLDKPIPYTLIKKMVKFKLKQYDEKTKVPSALRRR